MWETTHSERSSAQPEDVWALWADAARWPEWNAQFDSVEVEGGVAVGQKARVKMRRGGRMEFEILAADPERGLVYESRMPGARLGHEHRLDPTREGVEITHRIYVRGPLSGLFALLLGRKRMRESVAGFIERERALVEGKPQRKASSKRRRRR